MTITRFDSIPRMSRVVIHANTVYLAGQVGSPGEEMASHAYRVEVTIVAARN